MTTPRERALRSLDMHSFTDVDDAVEAVGGLGVGESRVDKAAIIWVDIETTGLDPKRECILEISLVVTDRWGNLIDEIGSVVTSPRWESKLASADPYVVEMHKKNGLADELRDISKYSLPVRDTYSIESADTGVTEFLEKYFPDLVGCPMAGSSVKFDLDFIAHHMPRLAACFHRYRVLDVTSLLNVAKAHGIESDAPPLVVKEMAHRAFPDILNSIQTYKRLVLEVLPKLGGVSE